MRVDAEVTQGRSLLWPLAAAGLSGLLLVVLARQDTVTPATYVATAALLTALSFMVLSRTMPSSNGRRRRVGADARGLSVDGELVLPRQNILHTRVREEADGRTAVIVEARGLAPSRVVRLGSARLAQALADTLEQAPREVVVLEALPPWAHRMRWLTIILTTSPWILFNLLRHLPGWSIVVVLGLYGVIGLPMILPQKVAIGDDGVLLRWAGQRRFVPYAALREVRATPLGVELELFDDERAIEIRLTHRADADESRRAAMLARIEDGLARHRALAPAEDEALLTRGERPLEAWIQEMSVLGASDAHGYRTIAIPRERLWAVLENPVAEPSAREGAALALRSRLDDEERERLAAVGQRSASPRLRIAVDAVVHAPDEPRLRATLENAEDEALPDVRSVRG